VDRGGVYADCHCRGGGDHGKQWHLEGIKHKKEKGVDLAFALWQSDQVVVSDAAKAR